MIWLARRGKHPSFLVVVVAGTARRRSYHRYVVVVAVERLLSPDIVPRHIRTRDTRGHVRSLLCVRGDCSFVAAFVADDVVESG